MAVPFLLGGLAAALGLGSLLSGDTAEQDRASTGQGGGLGVPTSSKIRKPAETRHGIPVGGLGLPSGAFNPATAVAAPPAPPPLPNFASVLGMQAPAVAPAPVNFNPNTGLDRIQAAQQQASQAILQLDALFNQRKEELKALYQLSETVEEKAAIQRQLAVIEQQRDHGTAVIQRVYTQAIEGSAEQAQATREAGVEAEQRTRETFQQGAQDLGQLYGGLAEQFGGAMGAGGEPLPETATAAIGDLAKLAEIEAAFDRRMFNVSADDIAFLGQAMGSEMGAQVSGLQREAMNTSAVAQIQHDQRVNSRIAAERAALQQAMQSLTGQYDQRRFGLQDQLVSLDLGAADLLAANQRHLSGLQHQSALAAQQQAQQERARQQELALRQMEMEYQQALAQYQAQQTQGALRGLGVPADQAGFADALGLSQDLGASLLFPDPATLAAQQLLQPPGGRVR